MVSVTTHTSGGCEQEASELLERLEGALNRGLLEIRAEAQRNLRDNDSVATGELRRSLVHGVDRYGSDLWGWIGMEPYGKFVEGGTRPHWPPIEPLLRWVKTKGLVKAATPEWQGKRRGVKGRVTALDRAEKSLAFAVARSISRKGTKPHPFLTPALEKLWSRLVDRLNRALGGHS